MSEYKLNLIHRLYVHTTILSSQMRGLVHISLYQKIYQNSSWENYEEYIWETWNSYQDQKLIRLSSSLHFSWGNCKDLAQFLIRNITREKYSSRAIFLAWNIPRTELGQILIRNFLARNKIARNSPPPPPSWMILLGSLVRNIPYEEFPHEEYSLWGKFQVVKFHECHPWMIT